MKNEKGFSLVEIIIIIAIIGVLLTIWAVSMSSKNAEIRDLKRINDMTALGNAMKVMKNEIGTYDRAFCDLTIVSSCARVENSELKKFIPKLSVLNDPKEYSAPCSDIDKCVNGNCNYTFTLLEEDNYAVLFHLEKGSDAYDGKGCYALTPSGISKVR